MDFFPLHSFLHIRFYISNTTLLSIVWVIQSVTFLLPIGGTALISARSRSASDDNPYSQIPAPRPLTISSQQFDNSTSSSCMDCKLGTNMKICSGVYRGECTCSSHSAICHCKPKWTGDACQYSVSKIKCENMRNCIMCQVYRTGPLADRKDCSYFCDHNYPTPLIVKTLHIQEDERLCSFIHYHANETPTEERPDSSECRFFFKFGPLLNDGSIDSPNLYVVAQQDMDCGKPAKFPRPRPITNNINNDSFHIFSKNYEEIVRSSEVDEFGLNEKRKNNFFALVVIFVFIALPFVTCAFSLIYNFSNLPCGLCNKFRQSSSKYIRNVRPFPGYIPDEEASAYFRNDITYNAGGGNDLSERG